MTTEDFFNEWNGKGIDFDHALGFQCMDVAQQYVTEVLGNPPFATPNKRALDAWTTYDSSLYDKVLNTPDGVPVEGDILFWDFNHIAIFKSGDTNTFISFDQNYPLQEDAAGNGMGIAHFQDHNWSNVLGWLHPKPKDSILVKKTDFETLVTKSTKYDAFVAHGYNSVDDVNKTMDALHADNDSQHNQIVDLQNKLQSNDTELESLEAQVKDLSDKLAVCQNQTPSSPTTGAYNYKPENIVLTISPLNWRVIKLGN